MGDAKVDKNYEFALSAIKTSQNMWNAALNRDAMVGNANTNIWLQSGPVKTLDLVNTGGSVWGGGGNNFNYGGNSDLAFAMGCMSDTANLVNQIKMSVANGTSSTGAGQKAGTQQQINLNNSAETFSNLTPDILKDMKAKEAEIKAKEARFKELDEKEGLNEEEQKEKETLAKSLGELKENYRELDKKYGNGSPLSGLYGEEFNFYGNFDNMDLTDINNQNARINSLKSQLESKKKSYSDKIAELQKKAQEIYSKTGKPATAETLCSKTEKDYVDKLEKEINELQQKISQEIDNNSTYINEAAKKDDGHLSFNVFRQRKEIKDREEAKKAGNAQVVSELANALFDKDGNAVSVDDIKKAIKTKNSSYSEETINAVAKFLQKQIKDNGKSKADFEKYLESDKFFEAVQGSTTTKFNATDGADNLRLLVETYDAIKGDGAFKKAVNGSNNLTAKGTLNKAIDGLKKQAPVKPPKAAEAPEKKPPVTPENKPPKTEGADPAKEPPKTENPPVKEGEISSDEAATKVIHDIMHAHTNKLGITNWDAVEKAVAEYKCNRAERALLEGMLKVAKEERAKQQDKA
ncbi:MAG: hypothetical protein MJ180_04670 [Candidatus Gastranaerophilales bacterium]|nr:hypothetical protein [Candidatus Gastranaerophilales bacterium]